MKTMSTEEKYSALLKIMIRDLADYHLTEILILGNQFSDEYRDLAKEEMLKRKSLNN